MKDIKLYEKVPLLENNFPIRFMEFTNTAYLPPHWHEHIELLYFLSGKCRFTCNGKGFSVGANDFIIANNSEIHSFTASENVSYYCMLIYPDFFSDVSFNSRTMLENIIHDDKYIREIIFKMYTEYASGEQGSDMALKGCAYQLMTYLMRNYTTTQLSDRESYLNASMLKRTNTILDYISNHYQEKITTSELAKLCFISEGHLCRFLKNNLGKSATEYINEFRIEKAAVMLINTDESITNIAAEVGFEDMNYFSRTFKKIKKESPMDYRKNHRDSAS